MSKKQEALRRGLRSFFEDTSDEFADLEGRPLRRAPAREADTDTALAGDAVVDVVERDPAADTLPEVKPEPPRLQAETPSLRHEVRAAPSSKLEPPAPPAHASATLDVASIPSRSGAAPAPASSPPAAKEPAPEPPQAPPSPTQGPAASGPRYKTPPSPPPAGRGEVSAAPVQAQKPKPRAQAPARRRPRPAVEIGADGVNPAQAHARKGVCFAYFLNHDCWRVPDAYCNSALQVCITRECPIYHLHKDAFERRFAKKFRHFW